MGPNPPCQAVWQAGAVFTGEIVSVTDVDRTFEGQPSVVARGRRARVRVLESFRGTQTGEVDVFTHWGILTRAGTPQPIVAKLAESFGRAVRAPELTERLAGMGFIPAGGGPSDYAAVIARETEKFTRVIRAANIRPD